jgi:hypothetical protein
MTPERRPRVAVFGTFYPVHQYAGCSTTGIALALALGDRVEHVTVYAQDGARLPEYAPGDRISLKRVWSHDDPGSLCRALLTLWRDRSEYDLVLFNTYVTAFGRRPLANVAGLLLPTLTALSSRRSVTTYMHNLVETQDIRALGYSTGWLGRSVAHALEWGVIRTGQVVVPLRHQADRVRDAFDTAVPDLLLPYVEGVASVLASGSRPPTEVDSTRTEPRLVAFGSIGPQKDISGFLRTLDEIGRRRNRVMTITLAGSASPQFPDARREVDRVLPGLANVRLEEVGPVSEDDVVPFLLHHDVALLPYHATGGISGVLNLSALTGLDVIAYDHPQLREQAARLGVEVRFVEKGSPDSLERALDGPGPLGRHRLADPDRLRERLGETVRAVETLVRVRPGLERAPA